MRDYCHRTILADSRQPLATRKMPAEMPQCPGSSRPGLRFDTLALASERPPSRGRSFRKSPTPSKFGYKLVSSDEPDKSDPRGHDRASDAENEHLADEYAEIDWDGSSDDEVFDLDFEVPSVPTKPASGHGMGWVLGACRQTRPPAPPPSPVNPPAKPLSVQEPRQRRGSVRGYNRDSPGDDHVLKKCRARAKRNHHAASNEDDHHEGPPRKKAKCSPHEGKRRASEQEDEG